MGKGSFMGPRSLRQPQPQVVCAAAAAQELSIRFTHLQELSIRFTGLQAAPPRSPLPETVYCVHKLGMDFVNLIIF